MRKLLKKAEILIKSSNTPDVETWQKVLIDFEQEVKRVRRSKNFVLAAMNEGYVRTVVDNDELIFYKRDKRISTHPDDVLWAALLGLGFRPEGA